MARTASSKFSPFWLVPVFCLLGLLIACNPGGGKSPDRTTFISEFAGYDSTGKRVDLGSLGNKPVIMDVWATWCGPCIQQRAILHAFQAEMGDQVEIVAMSIDQNRDAWVKYVKESPAPHLDLYAESNTADVLKVRVIPTMAIFDKRGQLVRVYSGTKSVEDLKKLVQPLL